jgi:hypothetical protein
MVQLQIAYLPRPGTQERWRRLCQELAGSRRDRFAASCQQAGITQVQVRLLQLLRGELLLITLQTGEQDQTLEALASSVHRFDHWLREQLQLLLGWNVQEVLPGPQGDLIFTWPGECECDDWWAEAESTRASSSPEVEDDDVP